MNIRLLRDSMRASSLFLVICIIICLVNDGHSIAQPMHHVTPCPVQCTCQTLDSVSCHSTYFSTNDLPEHVTSLSLHGYDSQFIHNVIVRYSATLRHLDLSTNNLTLSTETFNDLSNLTHLNLSSNNLRSISNQVFARLDRLTTLDLSNNEIDRIPEGTFPPSIHDLDLSRNSLTQMTAKTFSELDNLNTLNLSNNYVTELDAAIFHPLKHLQKIDLSANPLTQLPANLFASTKNLQSVMLNNLNLTTVDKSAFQQLTTLTTLSISQNPSLSFINPDAFQSLTSLQRLLLINNNLTSLHKQLLYPLKSLTYVDISGNPWTCDCQMAWLNSWLNATQVNITETTCKFPPEFATQKLVSPNRDAQLNCSETTIANYSQEVVTRLGATALLECRVSGNPRPSLTWILPRNHHIFHLYPASLPVQWYFPYQLDHPAMHDTKNVSTSSAMFTDRIRVLKNGNLFISQVLNVDAGTYTCMASNSLSNATTRVTLTLNYQILIHVKLISILVGVATSIAMLFILLVFQLVNMAINRWGCCCCRDVVSPKAKQIKKMLETVEQYKSQQLERLRENYAMQVNRIKDNCTQQMDKIRDSYGTQVDRLRDICDFGTQQLDKVRDQYYEQVKKVRDYSSQQMSKVRENYIFQRNRIRKFSAHQLIRFRENYKVQQLHLNKILETLNIESCRMACSRSDSLDFVNDPVFNPGLVALPPPPFDDIRFGSDQSDKESTYFTPAHSRTPSSEDNFTSSCASTPVKVVRELVVVQPIIEAKESDTCQIQIELECPEIDVGAPEVTTLVLEDGENQSGSRETQV